MLALEVVSAIDFKCTFVEYLDPYGYTCIVWATSIKAVGEEIAFDGEHVNGNDETSVRTVAYLWSLVHYLPPEVFTQFPELEILNLQNSCLKEITKSSLEGAVLLKRLYLKGNHLQRIGANVFSDCPELEILYLSSNNIDFVERRAFNGLANLKKLKLDKNYIKVVCNQTFSELTSLTELHLQSNRIETLEANLFDNNKLLEFLDLRNNKIEAIDPNVFDCAKNLKTVNFLDNTCLDELFSEKKLNLEMLPLEILKCT